MNAPTRTPQGLDPTRPSTQSPAYVNRTIVAANWNPRAKSLPMSRGSTYRWATGCRKKNSSPDWLGCHKSATTYPQSCAKGPKSAPDMDLAGNRDVDGSSFQQYYLRPVWRR